MPTALTVTYDAKQSRPGAGQAPGDRWAAAAGSRAAAGRQGLRAGMQGPAQSTRAAADGLQQQPQPPTPPPRTPPGAPADWHVLGHAQKEGDAIESKSRCINKSLLGPGGQYTAPLVQGGHPASSATSRSAAWDCMQGQRTDAICRAYLTGPHAARMWEREHTSMRAPGAPGGGRRSTDAHCAARLCSSSSGAPSASVPRQPLSGAAPVIDRS